jgi:exopolysaccharide production protein ExoQ
VNKIGTFLEQAFSVMTLVVYSGGLLTLLTSGGAGEADVEVTYDTSFIRIFYFAIYLVTIFLLTLRWRNVVNTIKRDKYIWMLVVLPLISMCWSFDRSATMKDSVTIVGSSLFGLYLATRYTIAEQLQIIAIAAQISIVSSTLFAVFLPSYGVMTDLHAGAWRGIHTHKNGLGQMVGLSTLVFIIQIIDDKKRSYLAAIGLVFSVTLLVLSKSTASITNTLLVLPFFGLLHLARWRYQLMIPTLFGVTTFALVSSLWIKENLEILASSVGKNTTLTGRTSVWEFVWDMILKHPWLGYGYGGFWRGFEGEAAYVWRATQWTPTHPHNGLLGIWLDLGLLGVSIYSIGFCRYFWRALVYTRSSRKMEGLWPMIYLVYLVLLNLTETHLFMPNSIAWVLYIACYCSIFSTSQPDRDPVSDLAV